MRIAWIAIFCLIAACSAPRANNAPSNSPAPTPAAEPETTPGPIPLPIPKPILKPIVVTTGVHGNEPSGVHVMDTLKEQGFIVYGPCNPWGIKNNRRGLENGNDLNRMFGTNDCPEAEAVKKFLNENPPGLLLDIHEDPNGEGAYLIQHGPNDDLSRRIIDEMKDEFEFDPNPQFLVVKGEDGLLKPTIEQLRGLKFVNTYGLAYHAWYTFGCTAIVTECPGRWDMEKKKRYALRVCELAKKFYSE
jgi:hypothetical protein